MSSTRTTLAKLGVMAAFVVSVFAILLYLWTSFGGPTPLAATGYRVSIDFPDAGRLAPQADVRMSGVSVGTVVALRRAGGRTRATIELRPRFVPLRADARAVLRQKSALGETYVQLTPGSRDAAGLPEGGHLPDGQVADAVLLDEALRAFDPATRRDLRAWLRGWSGALDGHGEDVSAILARLAPTEVQATRAMSVLDTQSRAVRGVLRDGGDVLTAVGAREAAVRRLIADGDAVLDTTARRGRALRDTVRALPALSRTARRTTGDLAAVSADLTPALRGLRPAARALDPVLRDTADAAPPLRAAVALLGRDATAAIAGVPATARLLSAVAPLSRALDPVARDLDPALEYLARYRQEIAAPFAVVAAVSQATEGSLGGRPRHYVRLVPNVSDETPTINTRRPASNRFNPYPAPRWLDRLATGLQSFSCSHTGNVVAPPAIGTAPPCPVQPPQTFRGRTAAFPHLTRDPPGARR